MIGMRSCGRGSPASIAARIRFLWAVRCVFWTTSCRELHGLDFGLVVPFLYATVSGSPMRALPPQCHVHTSRALRSSLAVGCGPASWATMLNELSRKLDMVEAQGTRLRACLHAAPAVVVVVG